MQEAARASFGTWEVGPGSEGAGPGVGGAGSGFGATRKLGRAASAPLGASPEAEVPVNILAVPALFRGFLCRGQPPPP